MRKKIVAGNWKMNKNVEEGNQLAKLILENIPALKSYERVIIFPPFIHLSSINGFLQNTSVDLGAQNCHIEKEGAYTGEISASMLKSVGTAYCLVGHSERRVYNFESDEELEGKIKALLLEDILPVFCCGEQLEDRKTNNHFEVIEQQLELLWSFPADEFKRITIAYEPVWAIGTGETASSDQAQEMHAFIRKLIQEKMGAEIAQGTSILYGGSCKPSNAAELFAKNDVDGGLIGGASLNADDFVAIINSLNA